MSAKRKGSAEAATSPSDVNSNLEGSKMKAKGITKPSADAIEIIRKGLLLDASDAVEDLKNCLLLVLHYCDQLGEDQNKNVLGFGVGMAISVVEEKLRGLIADALIADIIAEREAAQLCA